MRIMLLSTRANLVHERIVWSRQGKVHICMPDLFNVHLKNNFVQICIMIQRIMQGQTFLPFFLCIPAVVPALNLFDRMRSLYSFIVVQDAVLCQCLFFDHCGRIQQCERSQHRSGCAITAVHPLFVLLLLLCFRASSLIPILGVDCLML